LRLLVAFLFGIVTSCLAAQQTSPTPPNSDLPSDPASSQSKFPSSQQQTASQNTQQSQQPEDIRAEAARELQQQKSQRMLGIVPAFNSVISGHAAPLSPGQKFSLFVRSSTDPFVFVVTGVTAGYEQATNAFPEYGQGAAGFGKRYGAALADTVNGNFWGNAVLPSVLHQDPRYFRMGHGRVTRRFFYSVATTVICRGDNGKWQPNYSNVAGNFIAGGMSNLYYPPSDRGIGLTFERATVVTAEGALGSLALEFYPDVASWWKHRHSKSHASGQP
jgi:hypothetical protein